MPYLITFCLSAVLFHLSNSFYKKNQSIFVLLAFCSIMSISILAGVRDSTIGTDVLVYGNTVFKLSGEYSSFFAFYNGVNEIFRLEPLYMLLNYLISRITNNPAVFYFALSFIINSFIYISILNLKEKINMDLAWCSYLLIFYGQSLNIMRQSLAISAMILGFSYLFLKKEKWAFLFFLISCLSHFSAAFVLISVLLLYSVFFKFDKPFKYLVLFSIVGVLITIGLQPISQILQFTGILPERYSIYLVGQKGAGLSVQSIFLKIPFLAIFINQLINNPKNKEDKLFIFLFMMLVLDFLFYQLRITNLVFARISYYFNAFQIISIPFLIKQMKINYENRIISYISLGYLIYLSTIWYYQIVISGINEIYPYHSEILRQIFFK